MPLDRTNNEESADDQMKRVIASMLDEQRQDRIEKRSRGQSDLPSSQARTASAQLDGFLEMLQKFHDGVRQFYSLWLQSLEGTTLEDLEANVALAKKIQSVATQLQCAFACSKCGMPSRFKCVKNRTVASGVFTFAHKTSTHGGTSTIPKLVLTEQDADGREPPPEPTNPESEPVTPAWDAVPQSLRHMQSPPT